ncbi:MAG TPA: glycosyl hydrolase, partial [Streptosporangiaceae bacterium]|nr:glycosyl hydrolase [Streptosporangiaceae bacterium]
MGTRRVTGPPAAVAVALVGVFVLTVVVAGWLGLGRHGPSATALPTSKASYLGVYEKGPPASYQPVAAFARAAGRGPNLAGYYGGWGEPFKTAFARAVHQHGAVTLLQWDPAGVSVGAIAAGRYDGYLRSFAASVRDSGAPVVIGFGHEMNAYWYSWGYGHASPAAFVAAWRHIVALFRQQGARNVTWLWTLQADEKGTGPVASWWPGASYVTWVGIDGYYYRPSDTFFSVFG